MNVSNLNDLRSYSRHWLTEFIEQYQEEECLWQPKHHDYSNHAARNKAYDKLVEKLKEVEPNPDRAMVVRKINSLRSAFRREFRKSSSKSDYETRLWYYDKLLFIADHKPKRHSNELAGKPKRELHINFDDEDSMDFEEESHHTPQSQHIETIVPNPNDEVEEVTATNNVVVSSQGATLSTISVTPADCVTLVKDETHQAHNEVAEAHQRLVAQATAAQSSLAAAAAGGHAVKVLEITSLDSNSQREIQQVSLGTWPATSTDCIVKLSSCRLSTRSSTTSSNCSICTIRPTGMDSPCRPFRLDATITSRCLAMQRPPRIPPPRPPRRIVTRMSTMRLA